LVQDEDEGHSHIHIHIHLAFTHPHAQLAGQQTGAKIVADFTDFSRR